MVDVIDAQNIVKVLTILRKYYTNMSMLASYDGKNPFYILIATVLSARNRDEQTIIAVKNLFSKYKTPKQIADAKLTDIEKLIKKSGTFRNKAKNIKNLSKMLLEKYDGKVPDNIDEMINLPGVGRKTAGCTMVYAFKRPAIPVDTHVHKISNRLGWVNTKNPLDTEQELMKIVPKKYWLIVNEVFVLHGQNICRPINPKCDICPVKKYCKKLTL